MKVFKTPGLSLGETEQMLGEAILLSRIGHPNIVRVFDADTMETTRNIFGFFTMEYVAGGSLDQFWRSHGSQFVPTEVAVDVMRQVCQGLSVAHAEAPPIIHRDIKPQNILVGYDGAGLRARISDFGLAKRVNPLTLMASARGTRCFKPPEAFREPNSDSRAGDVWALGSTLYMLLTDRLPFSEEGDHDTFDIKSFERPMIPASRLNILVDDQLDRILKRALAIEPEDRYSSAAEMLADLNAWEPHPFEPQLQPDSSRLTDTSKTALGTHSPVDEVKARRAAEEAVAISRQVGRLNEAADLMEEAFNKWPDLRQQYEYQLKLWRRGISM